MTILKGLYAPVRIVPGSDDIPLEGATIAVAVRGVADTF
jgi:hypothetical protein